MTIVDQFGIKISGFTPSFEVLGEKKFGFRMSDFSCGETKVRNDP